MKKIIKNYFTFSHNEKVAAIILLLLIALFIALPYLFEPKKTKPIIDESLQLQLKKLHQNNQQRDSGNDIIEPQPTSSNIEIKVELFEFDPNTLNAQGWKRLGIRDKTINTILNYRNKGGKFYKSEDIRKIWGLQKNDADRIIPFAKILLTSNQSHTNNFNTHFTTTNKNIDIVDLNTATIEQLLQIPSIGHQLPYRIINFREKLGGFFTVQQIRETYGMTDSIYQKIFPYFKIESSTIKKININSATEYELSRTAFISKDIAKAIVIYRNQHGLFHQVEDIKKIVFINNEVYLKVFPYLTVQ